MLTALFDTYGLERFLYAETVQVEDGVIPHSHPVLTLSPRTVGAQYLEDSIALLAAYIHEQMHWFSLLESHGENGRLAIRRFEALYPGLPTDRPGGCGSTFSTYLHILVNWLEFEGLRDVLGEARARREIASRSFYTAVYKVVLEHDEEIRTVLSAHNLLLPAKPPADKVFRKVEPKS